MFRYNDGSDDEPLYKIKDSCLKSKINKSAGPPSRREPANSPSEELISVVAGLRVTATSASNGLRPRR